MPAVKDCQMLQNLWMSNADRESQTFGKYLQAQKNILNQNSQDCFQLFFSFNLYLIMGQFMCEPNSIFSSQSVKWEITIL